MATVSSEIGFTFNGGYSNALYNLTDTSTYSATNLTWSAADSRGLVKMVDPQGNTVYDNTDVTNPDLLVGNDGTQILSLPVDADGNVIQGSYTITLTLFDVNNTGTQYERSISADFTFASPTVDLNVSWSVINPIYLKSVDNTNYEYNNYSYTLTRTHTLYNPSVIGGSQSVTTKTLNTNSFYTGDSTIRLITAALYTATAQYTNDSTDVDFTIFNRVTTDKAVYIDDENSVCAQYCCIDKAFDNWNTAAINMTSSAASKERIYTLANAAWFGMKQSLECNQSQNVEKYRKVIQRLTNCSGDNCGCSDSTPTQVIGVGTTTEITRKLTYTASSNITSYTETELIGLDWSNGDFLVFVDGAEVESSSGTATFDFTTGEFTFGFTVFTGTEFYFQIIKR